MKILFVIYDNASYVAWFPHGIAYIAAMLRQKGHEVKIYHQDVYHWPEEHLTQYLDNEVFDVVGVGACGGYYQYRKVKKISDAINRSRQRPIYVLGGHLPSPEPGFFLAKMNADIVSIGEGELTWVELLDALENKKDLSCVNGIAYVCDGKVLATGKRELIKDVDSIPFPAWDMFPIDHYSLLRLPNIKNEQRCLPVLSGRGCPFQCNFCYRLDKGFRPRSSESIIEEVQTLKKLYNISYIAFSDELLMSSEQRTVEICESFIKARLNINWYCNGRLNYATPAVLKLMKDAGCAFINYGIESLDDTVLKNMKKVLTVDLINKGVQNTLDAGISPGLNVIFGNIGENAEVLKKDVEFLLRYDDQSQLRTIRPVTPYPGSPLYYYAIEKGLLKDCEDFYEHKHLNSDLLTVNFTEMDDDEFYTALYNANKTLIQHHYRAQAEKVLSKAEDLYFKKNAGFRGFRPV